MFPKCFSRSVALHKPKRVLRKRKEKTDCTQKCIGRTVLCLRGIESLLVSSRDCRITKANVRVKSILFEASVITWWFRFLPGAQLEKQCRSFHTPVEDDGEALGQLTRT